MEEFLVVLRPDTSNLGPGAGAVAVVVSEAQGLARRGLAPLPGALPLPSSLVSVVSALTSASLEVVGELVQGSLISLCSSGGGLPGQGGILQDLLEDILQALIVEGGLPPGGAGDVEVTHTAEVVTDQRCAELVRSIGQVGVDIEQFEQG